ncbi:MAG TPA: hydantoinase/oxoprolinase family protein [Chloroflexota bacterium]|nr:hydantoinase/oxoprolinase family protein [Chloroflexota bacterium]
MDADHQGAVVIGVDTGGTFTDIFSSAGRLVKVPSTPRQPEEAILEGLRAAGVAAGDAVAHGTTVATNAVLERKGARTALLTTAGFEDVLEIRRQNRPSLYDLNARWPAPLVPRERRHGVRERLDYTGVVLKPIDRQQVEELAAALRDEGVEAVAICLLFSYVNPEHEEILAARLATEVPASISHRIAARYGEFERTSTTVLNAYVMPVMQRYLRSLEAEMRALGVRHLHVMHSNGGLAGATVAAERPVETVLSGPAAGVVGARALSMLAGCEDIITFDMGGTSTDVAVVPGEIVEGGEGEIAGFPLLVPMLQIETVGAGGGSIARVDDAGGLHVGPQSAGAEPGPAAYGRGTQPTVTDANLVLGRLGPRGLLGGEMPLDLERARAALEEVSRHLDITIEQAAWAIVRLTVSNMERAARAVTLQRGHDPRRFTLFAYGGAGPLHAAELADSLGIRQILVPPHPGVMAALGLTVPDLQRDVHRTVLRPLEWGVETELEAIFGQMERSAISELGREELFGAPTFRRWVDARYRGQSFELRIPYSADVDSMRAAFLEAHRGTYGEGFPDDGIEIAHLRLRAVLPRLLRPQLHPGWPREERRDEARPVYFGSAAAIGTLEAVPSVVVQRAALDVGTRIAGPAVIEQYDSATLLPPGWEATVDDGFNLRLNRV